MNRGNNDGTTPVYAGDNMGAFDKLPKAVRVALANADHNWSGAQVLKEMRKRKNKRVPNAAGFADFIREHDANKHKRDADAGLVCPGQR